MNGRKDALAAQRQSLDAPGRADPAGPHAAGGWTLTSFPTITPRTRVSTALRLLDEHDLFTLPVSEQGCFVGLVDDKALLRCTPSELTAPAFREDPALVARLTVAECLWQFLNIAVSAVTPIERVATIMARRAARAVAVTHDGRPVGLLTWPFVLGPVMARAAADLGRARVQDWMITAFPTISRRTTVATAIALLQAHQTPVLPVCEHGRLLGFVDEKGLLRLTPSAATTETIGEIRRRLDDVPIGGRSVPAVSSVEPGTPLGRAAAVMIAESDEVVPVCDDGHLVGLLSWDRVMAAGVGEEPQPAVPARRCWLFWM